MFSSVLAKRFVSANNQRVHFGCKTTSEKSHIVPKKIEGEDSLALENTVSYPNILNKIEEGCFWNLHFFKVALSENNLLGFEKSM